MVLRLTDHDPCEWDLSRDPPATTAEGVVGTNGKWRFKALRKRVPIKRPRGFLPVE